MKIICNKAAAQNSMRGFGRGFGFCVFILCALFVQTAQAQNQSANQPKQIEKHKAWRVFTLGAGAAKTCYIVSEPMEKKPTNVRRGEIFISVAHRPGQAVYDEVSVRIGYPFSPQSSPFARVGADGFNFFTGAKMGAASSAWAWMENPAEHSALVDAMKRGNRLTFKGTSARGTLTTDVYSLLGFTAAKQKLDALCPQ